MSDLILNARFLMRDPSGVDRVATELIRALLQIDRPERFKSVRALRPKGHIATPSERPFNLLKLTNSTRLPLKGHAWEQISLAAEVPNDWLLSLCNMGPVLRSRQIVMMHDAQVFRQPESYSPAFRRWYKVMQPLLAKRAAMVLTVSEHSKAELEHFKVVPKGKAKVVYNGGDHILRITPDQAVLVRNGLEPGGFMLALGSLAPHKNLALLARATRLRKDRRIPLVIAGGGNAQIFGQAGIKPSEDVRIIGRVSDAELRALYDGAVALAFPSLTEGFGLPPIEAMFCHCPVIASTGGAIPEVCGDAVLYVDPRDENGWVQAMEQLSTNNTLRERLSQVGYTRASKFTWAASAQTLVENLLDLPS